MTEGTSIYTNLSSYDLYDAEGMLTQCFFNKVLLFITYFVNMLCEVVWTKLLAVDG